MGTFSNKAACEQALSSKISEWSKIKEMKGEKTGEVLGHAVVDGKTVFRTLKWSDGSEWKQMLRYICVPATMYLTRGPKGK